MASPLLFLRSGGLMLLLPLRSWWRMGHLIFPRVSKGRGSPSTFLFFEGRSLLEKWRKVIIVTPPGFRREAGAELTMALSLLLAVILLPERSKEIMTMNSESSPLGRGISFGGVDECGYCHSMGETGRAIVAPPFSSGEGRSTSQLSLWSWGSRSHLADKEKRVLGRGLFLGAEECDHCHTISLAEEGREGVGHCISPSLIRQWRSVPLPPL